MHMKLRILSLSLMAIPLLSACQSDRVFKAADYQQPVLSHPLQYQYAGLNWVETSNLSAATADWWQVYQDPTLAALMQRLGKDNLSLQQAEARYRQAMSLVQQQQATGKPNLDAQGGVSRQGAKHSDDNNNYNAGLKASWVLDVWGRVALSVQAAQANAQASAADLAAIQLNQQLLAAEAYWQIRGFEQRLNLLVQTQASYQRAFEILQDQFRAGMIARADVIQAETQLKKVGIDLLVLQRERALAENILAVLLGQPVSEFKLPTQKLSLNPPAIPIQVPSRLLGQRPDVIQTERELVASHAELGLAQTAWLPDINIGLDASANSRVLSTLLQSPQYLWSVGLQAAGTIFDGGKRKAQIVQAQARYDERLAIYKHKVLTGWKEVEDALLQSESFRNELQQQQQLLDLAKENERVVQQRYQAGMISYLEVVVAQNLRLAAAQSIVQLQQKQMQNSAQLIAALGAGWG